jgi:hypothetical protein
MTIGFGRVLALNIQKREGREIEGGFVGGQRMDEGMRI